MKYTSKALLFSALCATSGAAYAGDVVFAGGNTTTTSTQDNPFTFSSTEIKAPWVAGTSATSTDRAVWGGKFASSGRTQGEGFILADGEFYFKELITSGTGGDNSTLNILFDDASATGGKSQLTLNSLNWNTNWGNSFVFKGWKDTSTGTLKFNKSQSFSFVLPNGSTSKGTRYIEFGKGVEVLLNDANQNLELQGRKTNDTNLLLNGTLRIAQSANESLRLKDGAKMVIGSTGKLVTESNVILASATAVRSESSALTINSSNNEIGGYIAMAQSTALYVNAGNNFNSILARGSAVLVEFNAGESYVENFLVAEMENARSIEIKVAEGAVLKIGSLIGSASYDGYNFSGFGENQTYAEFQTVTIADFGEGRILVLGEEGEGPAGANNFLSALSVKGDAEKELFFSKYDAAAGGYWLTAVAIPEPAEWAAIFGALALTLAIYRRRK